MRQQRNPDDAVLRHILAKEPLLSRARVRADILDVTSSYLFDRLVRHDSFASQWGKLGPGTNPLLKITNYRLDSDFMTSAQAIMASGMPYLMIHLPRGSDLSEHHELLQMPGTEELLESLEAVMHQTVIRMTPYLNVSPDDGMKMCITPSNCHPSHFGMEVYSSAVQKIVLEQLK
jgi:hypothetical protein